MKKRLLMVINDPSFFLSHRLPIALSAKSQGYDVHVATGPGVAAEKVVAYGLSHHEIPLTRSGKNLLAELNSLLSLYRLMRMLKPDLVHLVTIKPVLYGGIAARFAGVNAMVAAISGLGSVFVSSNMKNRILRSMILTVYKLALGARNIRVIFQNPDDENVLLASNVVDKRNSRMIRGSGIDLSACDAVSEPNSIVTVVMASRLLREKGVYEFIEAAKILRSRNIAARFVLVGSPDPGNPSSITSSEILRWTNEKVVELLGFRTDILDIFKASHIITLPSYYGEGLPKVLIEAAACARPVVTTDNPGCRDAIEPGVTGVLVPTKNSEALADAIQRLIEDKDLRQQMGLAGRSLAEREFSIQNVIEAHLGIYNELVS